MAQKEYLKMADVFIEPLSVREKSPRLLDCCGVLAANLLNESGAKYAANAINSHDELVAEVERLRNDAEEWPKKVDSVEDITEIGTDILVYDGCDWAIDWVDVCVDTGALFMSNGHEVEQWMPLPNAK